MHRHARKLFVAVLAMGIALGVVAPAGAFDNRVQFIRGQGSDSTYDIMQKLDTLFNNSTGCVTAPSVGDSPFNSTCVAPGSTNLENNDHDVAISFFPVGSSNGIKILDRFGLPNVTKIDYARSSRAKRTGSGGDNAGLRFVAYAQDATPWVNFRTGPGDEGSPAAGVDDLTLQEIKDIFLNKTASTTDPEHTCVVDNWSDPGIGGADAPILVWTSQPGSGERASFDSFIGGDSTNCIALEHKDNNLTNGERVIFENDATPIRNCETYAGSSCPAGGTTMSIYHTGFGAHGAFPDAGFGKNAGADLGKINGVDVNPTTIENGTYLARRLIYNVYRATYPTNNVGEATYEYMSEEGWICKPNHTVNPRTGVNFADEIASTISSIGFIPFPTAPQVNLAGDTIQSRCRVS